MIPFLLTVSTEPATAVSVVNTDCGDTIVHKETSYSREPLNDLFIVSPGNDYRIVIVCDPFFCLQDKGDGTWQC